MTPEMAAKLERIKRVDRWANPPKKPPDYRPTRHDSDAGGVYRGNDEYWEAAYEEYRSGRDW